MNRMGALGRIPKDESGEPMYGEVDADTAWDAILEQTEGDKGMAKSVVDSMVEDKRKALEEAEKSKAKQGGTISEKIKAEKERQAVIDRAKADLAHWEEIAQTEERRGMSEGKEEAEPKGEVEPKEKTEPKSEPKVEKTEAKEETEPKTEVEPKEYIEPKVEKTEPKKVKSESKEEKSEGEPKVDETTEDVVAKEGKDERADEGEIVPIGKGVFGDIYDQFKGRVKEAFKFLMKHKGGDLLGVFHRDDIGDIGLVWGDYNGGLTHIIRRHISEQNDFADVDEVCSVIENVIKNGKIARENKDKVNIEYDGYRVSVGKTIRDEKGNIVENKNWVITAFDKSKPKHEKRRTSSSETLTTPSTNQEADGVTLPSNEVSSEDKGTIKDGGVQGNGRESVNGDGKASSEGKERGDEGKVEEKPKNSGEFGLVSDDRMEELKKRMRKKLYGQLNLGIDPELLAIGAELTIGYFDRGVRRFADFAKRMVDDLGMVFVLT